MLDVLDRDRVGAIVLASEARITWKQGDATKAEDVQRVAAEGGFTGVVHAIGMLSEGELNKFGVGIDPI